MLGAEKHAGNHSVYYMEKVGGGKPHFFQSRHLKNCNRGNKG